MTVIVTGAAGFVGSHLSEALANDGFDVVGIDNFHPYYDPALKRHNISQVQETTEEADGSFEFVEGTILDDADLEQLPDEPEYVFHQAAIAGVRYSIQHPAQYAAINVHGTVNLLKRFDETEKFVFASSSSVYGEVAEAELPVQEDRDLAPIAPYPQSKVQAEEWVRMFNELYGLPYANLRYFTVYGPRQRPDEAFTKFISRALNDETIPIYGDGEQSRDFTHISDIVRGNILAAERGNGTYNLGSGRRVTVNEMVTAINEHVSCDHEHVEQPDGDVSHTHADISKAENELGYAPQTGFADGVESCVDWCRQMQDRDLL